MTPEEEKLEAKKANQAMHIEILRTDPEVEEFGPTRKDHDLCHKHGSHYGCVAKFRDNRDGTISTFCDLTPFDLKIL